MNTYKSRMCCHPVAGSNILTLLEVHPETLQWILLTKRLYIIAVTFSSFLHDLLPQTSPMLSNLLSYILSLCSLPWIKSVFISLFHLFQQILIPMESAHSFSDSCKACPKLLLCALKNFVLALLTYQLFVQWRFCSLGKLPLFFILPYLPLQTERMQSCHCPWCLHY